MNKINLTHSSEEGVTVLQMSDRDNRFSLEMVGEMMAALDQLENEDSTRALVLTGTGKFFSNGLDLEWMMANASNPEAIGKYLFSLNRLYHRWTLFPKPTVAALNGHTFAGGFFLAAHLDFRLMREDRGWCSLPEVSINIPLLPGMIAICQAVMPPQSFRKLYYSGDRFTGPQSKAMGFVDEVYPEDRLLPEAEKLASKLGRAKTRTYAEMKRRIRTDIASLLLEEDPKHFAATLGFAI